VSYLWWSPFVAAILTHLCRDFLGRNVTAILLLTNYERYGRETASTQYFLQLANYLRIPVIAWNADNSGLERVSHTHLFFSKIFNLLRNALASIPPLTKPPMRSPDVANCLRTLCYRRHACKSHKNASAENIMLQKARL